MEPLDRSSCEHAGQLYPEASQVCGHEVCMICKDGEWVDVSEWPPEEEKVE